MKEHPIIFSASEVRAILDGRKTQMRRVVKPQPLHDGGRTPRVHYDDHDNIVAIGDSRRRINCPYGKPGDRLWVRETWRLFDSSTECACYDYCGCSRFHGKPLYKASHDYLGGPWKPSISMPRWASRITLEITNVRVERLQDISGPDCWAEGIEDAGWDCEKYGSVTYCYRDLWESIYGPGSWDRNDWVWVIEFKLI